MKENFQICIRAMDEEISTGEKFHYVMKTVFPPMAASLSLHTWVFSAFVLPSLQKKIFNTDFCSLAHE